MSCGALLKELFALCVGILYIQMDMDQSSQEQDFLNQQEQALLNQQEQFLSNLKRRVKSAVKNAPDETLDPSTGHTIEEMQREKEDEAKFEEALSSSMDSIQFPKIELRRNQVVCENPHDYPTLLGLSFAEVSKNSFLGKWLTGEKSNNILHIDSIIQKVMNRVVDYQSQKVAKHEFQHHVPFLGTQIDPSEGEQPKLLYGVEFVHDIKSDSILIQPFIHLEGDVPKDVYFDMIEAVEKPSFSDLQQASKKRG